ncbi:MAG: phenylacetic acid degradation bifunctional protein PaaZ [Beijerinckiaceae bacterium]|nr:phenylacetic acid degradation bifunctional protein PaaZ [Beijerinckiaceae bacterium]
MTKVLKSFARGRWFIPSGGLIDIPSAVDGKVVARASSLGLEFAALTRYARERGAAIRGMTFHERAALLKRLANHLSAHKDALYALSGETGATQHDSLIDVDGGIGTLFAYASRGRRELPDEKVVFEGVVESLSKTGSFVGAHMMSPLHGVAVHVNAFNFPCWGMLEKFAPAFLAGMPVITKPATATAYVAEALVEIIVDSGILPEGALQFVCGSTGDLLDHLTGQDVVAFTGSLETSEKLRNHPTVSRKAVRFVAERDSLNAAILGPDAGPGTPEFDLFVKEVVREMTVKAGQKCTAIRRLVVPSSIEGDVIEVLRSRLAKIKTGDPRSGERVMGPLASLDQRREVRAQIQRLRDEADIVAGDPGKAFESLDPAGAYMEPVLLRCRNPKSAVLVHEVEAFGPVATVIGYDSIADAVTLVEKGEGSLVASIHSYDTACVQELVSALAPYHGRLLLLDRDDAAESTGHGSPLPMLVHGGPGRAGGGEELGGLRGVFHYMQRTAIQASPERLSGLMRTWIKGAPAPVSIPHPFRLDFAEIATGQTVETESREITLADIEHFAEFTGDKFYAHMDEAAAKANPFFPGRVAHGYLVISFAAGLFVDPAPGPLLANSGLDTLRFLKPVSPGDSIRVRLTVKSKRPSRSPEYGEVRWDAEVFNQHGETVARYDLLTMSARPAPARKQTNPAK